MIRGFLTKNSIDAFSPASKKKSLFPTAYIFSFLRGIISMPSPLNGVLTKAISIISERSISAMT